MARIGVATTSCLLVCALVATASAAPSSPATRPGWPRTVAAGPVLPGPSGGLVVVSRQSFRYTVRAFRRDGRPLWTSSRTADCGNCDDGPQPEALQADGTYGPIGAEGDDIWAVDPRGRIVPGCAGVVSRAGGCVAGDRIVDPASRSSPGVRGRPAGGPPWTVSDDRYEWQDDSDVPPVTVADHAGLVYAAFASPVERSGGRAVPGLLMAVNPSARAIIWTRVGPTEALTALGAGLLVSRDGGIAAIGPDGADRWVRGLPPGQRVSPDGALHDAARGRLYISRTGAGAPGVTALVAGTGAQVWRTRPRDRARLLSVGRGGRVYLAIDAPSRRAVRAVRLADGAVAWERRTSVEVRGARELANGTVAVSAGARFASSSSDRLTVLDPR